LDKNLIFGQKYKFWTKIEILDKNINFGQKSKFWTKIEILDKNRNFDQKSIFWKLKNTLDKSLAMLAKKLKDTKTRPDSGLGSRD